MASLAIEKLKSGRHSVTAMSGILESPSKMIWVDLDCCISQSMKDNFARGVYPTLQEREEFARTACAHVKGQCERMCTAFALVSFSFVNADLREAFRESFPNSTWILLSTSEGTAEERMKQRKDHFYKGKGHIAEKALKTSVATHGEARAEKSKSDNSDWAFAPVTFPHTVLNGEDPAEANADRVVQIVVCTLTLNNGETRRINGQQSSSTRDTAR